MTAAAQTAYQSLRESGWEVAVLSQPRPLPAELLERYPWIPPSFRAFAEGAASISLPGEQVWILTAEDYCRRAGPGWAWNGFERMELGWAEDAKDAEERARTERFWANHFPILMAVFGDYAYLALEAQTGAVVGGWAPMFDETSVIATSFDELIPMLVRREPPVKLFLG